MSLDGKAKYVLGSWKAFFFSESRFKEFVKEKTFRQGLIGYAMLTLLTIFVGLGGKNLGGKLVKLFVNNYIGILMMLALVYGLLKVFRSKTSFKRFIAGTGTTIFFGALFLAIITQIVFVVVTRFIPASDIGFAFQMILPMYITLMLAWSAEQVAGLKPVKSVLVALIILFIGLGFLASIQLI